MAAAARRDLAASIGRLTMLCCGAAHMDKIMRLRGPAMPGRTNPVGAKLQPGGVAANIARRLAQLGARVQLCCPPPPGRLAAILRRLDVTVLPIGAKRLRCSYTAVINTDGELELGLADMDDYDAVSQDQLPARLPGASASALLVDAAFSRKLTEHVAQLAHKAGIPAMAAGTSPAKVGKLAELPWSLFVLNEAEARVLAGRGRPDILAARIARDTRGWVAVTCGADGAVLTTGDSMYRQAPPPASVDNANGAGDAFAATLCACRSIGIDAPEALRLATVAGASISAGRTWQRGRVTAALQQTCELAPSSMHLHKGSWRTLQ